MIDPLNPSPDEGRSWLRRELLRPEYHDENLVQRLLDRIVRSVAEGLDAAARAPALSIYAGMVVFALLVAGLLWLLTRARDDVGERRRRTGPVLTDEQVTARDLRARAEAALAAGRDEDALVDAFRALALRQVERHRLDDLPGSTAHEVAGILGATYPTLRERINAAADLFDAVLYGGRPANPEQARFVLELDDDLVPSAALTRSRR